MSLNALLGNGDWQRRARVVPPYIVVSAKRRESITYGECKQIAARQLGVKDSVSDWKQTL